MNDGTPPAGVARARAGGERSATFSDRFVSFNCEMPTTGEEVGLMLTGEAGAHGGGVPQRGLDEGGRTRHPPADNRGNESPTPANLTA